jgi:hypothetical protein
MSGLDNLVALIDNGGTRCGFDRRTKTSANNGQNRRSNRDRRSGTDRRRVLNEKRNDGEERRMTLAD